MYRDTGFRLEGARPDLLPDRRNDLDEFTRRNVKSTCPSPNRGLLSEQAVSCELPLEAAYGAPGGDIEQPFVPRIPTNVLVPLAPPVPDPSLYVHRPWMQALPQFGEQFSVALALRERDRLGIHIKVAGRKLRAAAEGHHCR